jgi:ribosomal protein S18 acetylase RimI-like enzyme
MTHVLDNPVWHALTGRQSHFARGDGAARSYWPDISPFAGIADATADCLDELADLLPAGSQALVVMKADRPFAATAALAATAFEGIQMVGRAVPAARQPDFVVDLGPEDSAAMVELATLTRPGPFLVRTPTLGGFVGIRQAGRLIAMAGERFKLEGITEVSGVCTHPDWRGRGYAGLLSRIVATRIAERGETPILHAFATNAAAIRLYGELGFVVRAHLQGAIFTRQ